ELADPREKSYPIDGDVTLRPEWQLEHLRLVVFLQEQTSGRILGAAQLPVG
nr:hypothetical protein [Gemmatimonadota bacterium]